MRLSTSENLPSSTEVKISSNNIHVNLIFTLFTCILHVLCMQYFTNNFPQIKFTSRTSVRDILTIPSVVPIKRTNQISIGNSMTCRDIWHKYHEWYFEIVIRNRQFWNITSGIYAKYHAHIILLFVYTATRKRFVIFTCRYFKWSWNTTALSQSNCRNFSCGSIIMFNCDNVAKKQNSLLFFFYKN